MKVLILALLLVFALPSERTLANVKPGLDDMNLPRIAGLGARYPNLVQFEEDVFTIDFVAFSQRNDIVISVWERLEPCHVGITRGWKILETNIGGTKSLPKVRTAEQLFSILDVGQEALMGRKN